MEGPGQEKGDEDKKNRDENDIQQPSKIAAASEELAFSPSTESSKGVYPGLRNAEGREEMCRAPEEIASQPAQIPEPEVRPGLQLKQYHESVPAPKRPLSINSKSSHTIKTPSIRGKKATYQRRRGMKHIQTFSSITH
jgi:hypothetical protein